MTEICSKTSKRIFRIIKGCRLISTSRATELCWRSSALTLERTRIRVEASEALKEYGVLLQTLTNSSKREELGNAAESFVASLRNVEGVYLDDRQAGAIAQIVQAVGGLRIEQMLHLIHFCSAIG